jgi:hypothetical protein
MKDKITFEELVAELEGSEKVSEELKEKAFEYIKNRLNYVLPMAAKADGKSEAQKIRDFIEFVDYIVAILVEDAKEAEEKLESGDGERHER